MSDPLSPGSRLGILTGAREGGAILDARVIHADERRMRVAVTGARVLPTSAVALAGEGAGQRHAHVSVAPATQGAWDLRLLTPWRITRDKRSAPRFPAYTLGWVRARNQPSLPANVLDISERGAAVHVPAWTGEDAFDLQIETPAGLVTLPCDCVHAERSWSGVVLHTAFRDLTPAATRLVCRLLDGGRGSFERAQQQLAIGEMDEPVSLR